MDVRFENDSMLCPACSGEHTHLRAVMVRAKPNDGDGVEVIVLPEEGTFCSLPISTGDHGVRIVPAPTFASGRRDHLVLRFWCEDCGAKPELRFEQHKGSTLGGWVR